MEERIRSQPMWPSLAMLRSLLPPEESFCSWRRSPTSCPGLWEGPLPDGQNGCLGERRVLSHHPLLPRPVALALGAAGAPWAPAFGSRFADLAPAPASLSSLGQGSEAHAPSRGNGAAFPQRLSGGAESLLLLPGPSPGFPGESPHLGRAALRERRWWWSRPPCSWRPGARAGRKTTVAAAPG